MTQQKTERIAVGKRSHIAEVKSKDWEIKKNEVQTILDLYNAIGLEPLKPDEFNLLFNDTDVLIYEKITGGDTHLQGKNGIKLTINPKEALKILVKPNGYNELMSGLAVFPETCKKNANIDSIGNAYFEMKNISQYFELTENGALQFTEKLNEEIEEAGNMYIETTKGKDVYNFIQQVTEAFFENGLDKHFISLRPQGQHNMNGYNGAYLHSGVLAGLIVDTIKELNYESKEAILKFGSGSSDKPVFSPDFKDYSPKRIE